MYVFLSFHLSLSFFFFLSSYIPIFNWHQIWCAIIKEKKVSNNQHKHIHKKIIMYKEDNNLISSHLNNNNTKTTNPTKLLRIDRGEFFFTVSLQYPYRSLQLNDVTKKTSSKFTNTLITISVTLFFPSSVHFKMLKCVDITTRQINWQLWSIDLLFKSFKFFLLPLLLFLLVWCLDLSIVHFQ